MKTIKTDVKLHSDLFSGGSDPITLTGQAEFSIQVALEKTSDGGEVVAVVKYGDRNVRVSGDQTLTLTHRFTAEAVREMTPELLPISIEYRGQEYQLRRTRAGKLVLNK